MGAPKIRLTSAQLVWPKEAGANQPGFTCSSKDGQKGPFPRFLGALREAGAVGKGTCQQGRGSVLSFPPGKILALSPLAQETGGWPRGTFCSPPPLVPPQEKAGELALLAPLLPSLSGQLSRLTRARVPPLEQAALSFSRYEAESPQLGGPRGAQRATGG